MNIWIVTIGNSDVQLKTKDNWNSLYKQIRSKFKKDYNFQPAQGEKEGIFTVPARVLGMAYGEKLNENLYKNLDFPLLNAFSKKLQDNNQPDKIVVILTNQEYAYTNPDKLCPYWKDTCTLEPILTEYFKINFPKLKPKEDIKYLKLEPQSKNEGLDNWDQALILVDKEINAELSNLEINPLDIDDLNIYVSHQAGTPAISSAIQFVSLAKFGKQVSFLFTNEYEQEKTDFIVSSKYLRGIQIQKAKQLIKNGLPGAALRLLEEINNIDEDVKKRLEDMVSVFNISASLNKGHEFEVKDAIQRVVDALDLIEIFFREKNYIQGISLLAAAHETFLKAAILHEIGQHTIKFQINRKTLKVKDLIQWNEEGLFLRKDLNILLRHKLKNLQDLKLPDSDSFFGEDKKDKKEFRFEKIGKNTDLYKCLCNLRTDFQAWEMLKWICQYKREREDDLRNKLMHNLVGVQPKEVIKYLLGNKVDPKYTDVLKTYQQAVKKPFLKGIKHLGLPYKENNLQIQLETLANDIR